jgi:hypothetical protein
VERVDLRGCGRAKTVGKIIGIPFSFFFIFLVIFVLFNKYGNQYENRIRCHRNRSEYDWVFIPSVFRLGRKI